MEHLEDKPALQLKINGKHICTAGICGNGVLIAELHINTIPAQKKFLRKEKEKSDCYLCILGAFDDYIYRWRDIELKPGDVVSLKIIEAESIDEPEEIKHKDKMIKRSWFFSPECFYFWKYFRKKPPPYKAAFTAKLNSEFICDTSLPLCGSTSAYLRLHNMISDEGTNYNNSHLSISWSEIDQSIQLESFNWYFNDNLQVGDKMVFRIIEDTATEIPPEFKPEKVDIYSLLINEQNDN